MCLNKALLFTLSTPPPPNQTYLWEFGDGSSNTQQNPSKVYSVADLYNVKLTVKNEFGCESVFYKIVDVKLNELEGTVTATPPSSCEGSSITLKYQPAIPSSLPNTYQWMRDNNPIGTTTVGTFTVNESGSYWVKTQDSAGCTSETFSTPAAFVMIPDAVILGPDAVCQGQLFQLSGYAGGTTTQYQWLKDGNIFIPWSNTNYQIEDELQDTNVSFDYTLQVRVPNGAGWCYLPDLIKTVMVYGPPAPPTVYVETFAESCNPYSIKVYADSNDIGTFTWSNGQSATNTSTQEITVFQGGPLQVTFTNPAGCSASTTVFIPKDPSVYMWIFPDGCYDSCTRPDEFLLGPNEEFVNWQWTENNAPASTGNSFVQNFPLPWASLDLNLVLNNGFCTRTSKNMSLNIQECSDCKLEPKLLKFTTETATFCQYVLTYSFINPFSFDIIVTISTSDYGIGIFNPSTITLPSGYSEHTFTMIPGNNFTGGTVNLTFQSITDKGDRCIDEFDIDFGIPCNQVVTRTAKEASNELSQLAKMQKLDIAPNPANHTTELYYEFPDNDTKDGSIEVYDVLGRLLESYKPSNGKGKWSLSLHNFAAGHYIVLMKKNDQIIIQKNLIVK